MDVILKKDHERLGHAMDVVKVRDGYARNFLIPEGIAVLATEGNKKTVAETRRLSQKREERKTKEAKDLAKKIENVPCTIPVKVGEEEKLFGSVGSQEIVEFLQKEGFQVERRAVQLEEPIRELGVYEIEIKLYRDVSATLKVWVVKDEKA